jgi:hypothetical protein
MVRVAKESNAEVAEEPRFETTGTIVRASRLALYLAGICAVVGTTLLANDNLNGFFVQLAAVTIAAVHLTRRPRKRSPVRMVVSEGSLYLDGTRVATRDEVVGISVTTTEAGPLVSIALHDRRTLDLGVESEARIAELRTALSLGLAHPASRDFRGHTPLGCIGSILTVGISIAVAYSAVGDLPLGVAWGTLFPLVLLGSPLLIARLGHTTVTCGEDAIHVKHLFASHFVAYAHIRSVHTPSRSVVVIKTKDRDVHAIELPTSNDASALVAEARNRMATQRSAGDESLVALLTRGDRSTTEWLGATRNRAKPGTEGYRTASLPDEQLWGVLEDPNADPTARVAAAVALRAQAGAERSPDLARRVRVAAGTTAFPQVRIALEGVVDASDDEQVITHVKRAGL